MLEIVDISVKTVSVEPLSGEWFQAADIHRHQCCLHTPQPQNKRRNFELRTFVVPLFHTDERAHSWEKREYVIPIVMLSKKTTISLVSLSAGCEHDSVLVHGLRETVPARPDDSQSNLRSSTANQWFAFFIASTKVYHVCFVVFIG